MVLTSPRIRARRTAELAGFASAAVSRDLVEWDYGDYEGRRTVEIRAEHAGWYLWGDGFRAVSRRGGGARVDRVLVRHVRALETASRVRGRPRPRPSGADRALAGTSGDEGGVPCLDTATLSLLGIEHCRPVVRRWNPPGGLGTRADPGLTCPYATLLVHAWCRPTPIRGLDASYHSPWPA